MKRSKVVVLISVVFALLFSFNTAFALSEWVNQNSKWDTQGCTLNVQNQTTGKWSAGVFHRYWENDVTWEKGVSQGDKLYVDAYTCYTGGKVWIYQDDKLIKELGAGTNSHIYYEFVASGDKIKVASSTDKNALNGESLSVTIILKGSSTESVHNHSYVLKYNETCHWEECSCGKKKNTEEHEYDKWKASGSVHKRSCKTCKYSDSHDAEFKKSYYSIDEKQHNLVEECQVTDCDITKNSKTENHKFGKWQEDSTSSKMHTRTCSKCGLKDSHKRSMEKKSDDNYTWKECKVCGLIKNKKPIEQKSGDEIAYIDVDEDDDEQHEQVPAKKILSIKYDEGSLKLYKNNTAIFTVSVGKENEFSAKEIKQFIKNKNIYIEGNDKSVVAFSSLKALDGKMQVYMKAKNNGTSIVYIKSVDGASLKITINITGVESTSVDTGDDSATLSDYIVTIDVPEIDSTNTLKKLKFTKSKLSIPYNEKVDLMKYLKMEPSDANYALSWDNPVPESIKLQSNGKLKIYSLMTVEQAVISVTDELTGLSATISISPSDTYVPPEEEQVIPEDISDDAWYLMAVMQALKDGIFTGLDDTHFDPEGKITRGMFITALSRLDKSSTEGYNCEFTDVEKDAYYAEAIAWATSTGIVNGMGDGTFKPENNLKREEMAKIIYEYIKKFHPTLIPDKATISLEMYKDQDKISDWATDAVYFLTYLDILHGRDNKKFAPQDKVTRAEAATVLVNLQTRITVGPIVEEPVQEDSEYDFEGYQFNQDKKKRTQNYSDEKIAEIEKELAAKIEKAGFGTRAGVVTAALYLCSMDDFMVIYRGLGLELNGKDHSLCAYPYIGFNKTWGRTVQARQDHGTRLPKGSRFTNGMDCGNFVAWCEVNGGVTPEKVNGTFWGKQTHNIRFNSDEARKNAEPGDLLSVWGYRNPTDTQKTYTHIGLVVGIDDDYFYIAEAVEPGIMVRAYPKNNISLDYYWTSMDSFYKSEGNMPSVNWSNFNGRLGRTGDNVDRPEQKDINDVSIKGIEDKTYTGSAITQDIKVKDGSKKLVENTDYTIAYSNNINVGTATIAIKGTGNYTGNVQKTFKILSSGSGYPIYESEAKKKLDLYDYANCRMIYAGNIAKGMLYRTCNPIIYNSTKPANKERKEIANEFLEKNGVKTIFNLQDDASSIKEITENSYYKDRFDAGTVFAKKMDSGHFNTDEFEEDLAEGLRFFANNDGPYSVHCLIGRDRTGFAIMVLECLMDVPYDYIYNDFVKSFEIYNTLNDLDLVANEKKTKDEYNSLFSRNMNYITGVKASDKYNPKSSDWKSVDLEEKAIDYLKVKCGMSLEEIYRLQSNLSGGKYQHQGGEEKPEPNNSDELKVLFIGNSKTYMNLYREYVISIANNVEDIQTVGAPTSTNSDDIHYLINYMSSEEVPDSYYSFVVGGTSFVEKYKGFTSSSGSTASKLKEAVKKDLNSNDTSNALKKFQELDVDIVIMQEGAEAIRDYDTEYKGAKQLLDLLIYDKNGNVKNPDLKIYIRNAWGAISGSGTPLEPDTETTKKVISSLNSDYKSALNSKIEMINDGEVFYQLYRHYEYKDDNKTNNDTNHTILKDARHQTYLSAYAAAIATDYKVFGIKPSDVIKNYIPSELGKNKNDNGVLFSDIAKEEDFLKIIKENCK